METKKHNTIQRREAKPVREWLIQDNSMFIVRVDHDKLVEECLVRTNAKAARERKLDVLRISKLARQGIDNLLNNI